MERYFDRENIRLIYSGENATRCYWDNLWTKEIRKQNIENTINPFVVRNTKKYLSKGSLLLEGGCGRGQYVYLLNKAGFETYGVDFAEKTVKWANTNFPELNISVGDVRNLSFPDNVFDGYWSFGVIEHFFNGYHEIALEMFRVLRPGGYLFMTVPTMSPLRKFLAKSGKYREWKGDIKIQEKFYQFALNSDSVIQEFQDTGFKKIAVKPYGGLKGFKDEVKIFRPLFQYIFDSSYVPIKAIKKILDFCFEQFAAHMSFYIFQKL